MLSKIRYAILALIFIVVMALTPFRPLKVSGESMRPTLEDGETYLLDHLYWKAGGIRRNDIVVLRHGEEKWVKRLLGVPGDRLRINYRFDGTIAGVRNVTVDPARPEETPDAGWVERQLAPGEIFVIGDNINHSTDSTNQEVGAFKERDIIGVVRTFTMRREFPFGRHL